MTHVYTITLHRASGLADDEVRSRLTCVYDYLMALSAREDDTPAKPEEEDAPEDEEAT